MRKTKLMKTFAFVMLGAILCVGCNEKKENEEHVIKDEVVETQQEVQEKTNTKSEPETSKDDKVVEMEEKTTTEEVENDVVKSDVIVTPLPNPYETTNATLNVSFTKEDIVEKENGEYAINVKIYTYDVYDMVDISMLEVGQTIVHQSEEIFIAELNKQDDGSVLINDGVENGGLLLVTDEDTTYYAQTLNGYKTYYEAELVELPLSDTFVLSDTINDSTTTYELSNHPFEVAFENDIFDATNTTMTIEDGKVVKIDRVFVP